jgi:hypothetical protein
MMDEDKPTMDVGMSDSFSQLALTSAKVIT